jgi:hypothetical protein
LIHGGLFSLAESGTGKTKGNLVGEKNGKLGKVRIGVPLLKRF